MKNLVRFVEVLCVIYSMVLLVSCNFSNHREGLDRHSTNYDLKVSSRQELMIGMGRMAVTDSFLIIASWDGNDEICKIYDVYDNNTGVCTYGKTGNGPSEFIQPVLTCAWENKFGLNELNKRELAILTIDRMDDGKLVVHEKKRLKTPRIKKQLKQGQFMPTNYFITKLDSLHYVSIVGIKNGEFFMLSDSTLIPICHFGESPIDEALPPMAARNRLSGKIAAFDGTMSFATSNLPYLAFYRMQHGKMEKIWSQYYAETGYYVRNGDLLLDKDKAKGPLLDIKMDSKYIYLLYLDQLLCDYDFYNVERSTSNKILVFDYDGNNVACFNLDCRIQEMAILSQQRKLYGLSQQPDLSLVEFRLPDELYKQE